MSFISKNELEEAKTLKAESKLRDKFAASALTGILSNQSDNQLTTDDIALLAYKVADKMINVKNKKK